MHEGMERLVQAVSPGSYIRIVSDGNGLEEKARMHLNRLCLHNEVAFTLIHDPFEFELPVSGRSGSATVSVRHGWKVIRQNSENIFKKIFRVPSGT